MSENVLLAQALWLLSVPEAAARAHGQHARGRISINEISQRVPTIQSSIPLEGQIISRMLTEAIVFARNAITRLAYGERPEAEEHNPLAFSESLLQSQQDVLPALSLFQRAHRAATELTENAIDKDDADSCNNDDEDDCSHQHEHHVYDVIARVNEAAARAGIASCHILLSTGHADPRDAASSASDALRGLLGSLRAAYVASTFFSDSEPALSVLQDLSAGALPYQTCVLTVIRRLLDRLQKFASSRTPVCRREAVGALKIVEELISMAGGRGPVSNRSCGRPTLVVQLAERAGPNGSGGSGGGSGSECSDGTHQFIVALQEVALEMRRCLAALGSSDAASAVLEGSLRAAHRRVSLELQREPTVTLLQGNDGGGGALASVPSAPGRTGKPPRGGASGAGLLQLSDKQDCEPSSQGSHSTISRSGGGGSGAALGGYDSDDLRALHDAGLAGGSAGSGSGIVTVRSPLSRIRRGSSEETGGDEDDEAAAAAAALAAADTATATSQWLDGLPAQFVAKPQSSSSIRSCASVTSSLSLSRTPQVATAVAPPSPPQAARRGEVFPLSVERLLQQQQQQPQQRCGEGVSHSNRPSLSLPLTSNSTLLPPSRSIHISTGASLHISTAPTSPTSPFVSALQRPAYPPSLHPFTEAPCADVGNGGEVPRSRINWHSKRDRAATAPESPGSTDRAAASATTVAEEEEAENGGETPRCQASLQQQPSLHQLLQQQRSRLLQLDPSFAASLPTNDSLSARTANAPDQEHQQQQLQQQQSQVVEEQAGSGLRAHKSSALRVRNNTVAGGGGGGGGGGGSDSGGVGNGGGGGFWSPSSRPGGFGIGRGTDSSVLGFVFGNPNNGPSAGSSRRGSTSNVSRHRSATMPVQSSGDFGSNLDNSGGAGGGSGAYRLRSSPSWQEAAAAAVAAAASAAAAGAFKTPSTSGGLNSVSSLSLGGPRTSISFLAKQGSIASPVPGFLAGQTPLTTTSGGASSVSSIVAGAACGSGPGGAKAFTGAASTSRGSIWA